MDMRYFWIAIVVGFVILLGGIPASAGFTVCNSSAVKQSVSVAYRRDGKWVSEGWWTVKPDGCKLLKAADLNVRYFYYRATVKGGNFAGERYMFCTDSQAFTITGKGDCAKRGYKSESFSEVEIGSGVTKFKLTLVDNKSTRAPAPAQTPQLQSQSGSLGEPFSVSGVFQGCEAREEGAYCAFHAEGWKWYLYAGTGTSASVMRRFKGLKSGDLIDVSGDILSYGDISVEAVARSVSVHGPRNENENRLAGLQGRWRNSEDHSSVMIIYGSESFEYSGSKLVSVSYLRFADQCEGSHGEGPVLIKTVPEDQDPFCYFITGWDAESLQLSYVGGGGVNDFFYEKIR